MVVDSPLQDAPGQIVHFTSTFTAASTKPITKLCKKYLLFIKNVFHNICSDNRLISIELIISVFLF